MGLDLRDEEDRRKGYDTACLWSLKCGKSQIRNWYLRTYLKSSTLAHEDADLWLFKIGMQALGNGF